MDEVFEEIFELYIDYNLKNNEENLNILRGIKKEIEDINQRIDDILNRMEQILEKY